MTTSLIILSVLGVLLVALAVTGIAFAYFQSSSWTVRVEHRREVLRLERQHLAWTQEQSRLQLARHQDRLEASLDREAGVDTAASELRGLI